MWNARLHLYGGKTQRNFLLLENTTWFWFLRQKRNAWYHLCALSRRVFNFYFSLRHRIFHEQVIPLYCLRDFIKNATHWLLFCFRAWFTRTKIKAFTVLPVYCLPHRRNITSSYCFLNSPCRKTGAMKMWFFRKIFGVWSRESKAKERLINLHNASSLRINELIVKMCEVI